ncbi:spore germination protein KB [Thalassobacillus devorans]|uniref:Spore germination protein KB n=1 Tax=Thalassobacillus devorans TaxID=279813 RepID=A0ABQ1PEE6_9BACI|nr:GerAB/ArcD/ProY family transporter [Thalassobacillus devorans]NIK29307.1 spore germination protein KB [Thalassobacillus devorans]GGC95665.1 spore germination protein KB [Thalassobacillus devorans]
MVTEKINGLQLFIMILLLELGSAVVLGFTFEAGNSSWLVIIMSTLGGIALYVLYTHLSSYHPTLLLTQAVRKITGPVIGFLIAIVYIGYFFYIAARVLGDFSNLLQLTILQGTPLLVVAGAFTLMVGIASYLGIEVLARTAEVLFPWVIVFGGLFLFFVYIDGLPDFRNLQPILDKGWKPIIDTTFPQGLTFPFGELIVFLMFFPYLAGSTNITRVGIMGVIMSGIILTITQVTILAVHGAETAKLLTIPLLETISLVNIQDIIQRMDPLVIITMIVLGFFKIALFFHAAIIGMHETFLIPRSKRIWLVSGAGIILIIITYMISHDYVRHIFVGLEIVPMYVHVPLQIILPVLLIGIAFLRHKINP